MTSKPVRVQQELKKKEEQISTAVHSTARPLKPKKAKLSLKEYRKERNRKRSEQYKRKKEEITLLESTLQGYAGNWKYIGPLSEVPPDGVPVNLRNTKFFKWKPIGAPGTIDRTLLSFGITDLGFGKKAEDKYPPEYDLEESCKPKPYRRYN